jgi:dipeptidyl aminopeptidase/acylaminoacyl peptidase
MHGYLSRPPITQTEKLPLVLLVHGGPFTRDTWKYHPTVQWLASRGYACLEINYRGSSGYGKDFLAAGNGEWGNKMHHDLIDGVNWAIEQGIADPKRIGIFGASYGGYAALVGATFTPDAFSCAVDYVGPSSLITLLNSIPAYWPLAPWEKRIGPKSDEEFLKSRSPLYKIDQIKIPIFVAHGAHDVRVTLTESEQLVEALKSKDIPYEYLVFEDEGHGFARPENRKTFYRKVEQFLAKHLNGLFIE